MATTIKKSKKTKRIVQKAQVHILASFNNTLVSVTDEKGSVLTWSSGGAAGFKGAREATPYAAQIAVEKAVERAKSLHSIESVDVFVKGVGVGREQAIRGIIAQGVDIKGIFDITPVPHNGCRKKKVRKL
ncbi:MAG: 30S ribosomal protein S11 [Candidatus Gracilibacteria bacterium]|nr:30S ribosomal protein S11 [Candidatus Gracilibacteria bacterium]